MDEYGWQQAFGAMGDVSPEKSVRHHGGQLDEEQERDCSVFCVRVRLRDMNADPQESGCNESHSFVVKESAEPRLKEHPGELFRECGVDDQCDEYAAYPVLLHVTVPEDGIPCRGDRDAAPDEMDQEGEIPEAEVDAELTGLVTVEEEIDEGQDDRKGKDEQRDESELRKPVQCVPLVAEPKEEQDLSKGRADEDDGRFLGGGMADGEADGGGRMEIYDNVGGEGAEPDSDEIGNGVGGPMREMSAV